MDRLEKMVVHVREMPESEAKKVMQSTLETIRELDNLQAQYDELDDSVKPGMPSTLREFFCDK